MSFYMHSNVVSDMTRDEIFTFIESLKLDGSWEKEFTEESSSVSAKSDTSNESTISMSKIGKVAESTTDGDLKQSSTTRITTEIDLEGSKRNTLYIHECEIEPRPCQELRRSPPSSPPTRPLPRLPSTSQTETRIKNCESWSFTSQGPVEEDAFDDIAVEGDSERREDFYGQWRLSGFPYFMDPNVELN